MESHDQNVAEEANSSEENNDEEETNNSDENNDEEETNSSEENNDEEETNSSDENNDEEETNSSEENNDEEETNSSEENNDEEETNNSDENNDEEETNSSEENNDEEETNSSEENNDEEETNNSDENEDFHKLQLNVTHKTLEEQVEGEISIIKGSITNHHNQELNLSIKVNYKKDFALLEVSPNTLKLGPKETTDVEIKHSLLQEGGVLLLKCSDSISKKSVAIRVCEEKDKKNTEESTTEEENKVTLWDKSTVKSDGEKGGYTDRAHGDEYQLIVIMYILLLAQKAKQCFQLACEFKKAGKFDDIYLHFLDNCTHYFLQLKHRLTEAKEENQNSKRAIVFEVDQLKKSKKKKKDYDKSEENVEKPVNVDGETYSLSGKNLKLIELCKSYEEIIEIDEVKGGCVTCVLFTNNETAVNQKKEKFSLKSIDENQFELPELINQKSQILDDSNIINELKNHFEDSIVTKFIQNFHLALNQLPVYDIKFKAKQLIQETTGSSNDIIYYHLRGSIDEWMKDTKVSFVTNNSFNDLFNSISKCLCINTIRHATTEPLVENFEERIGLSKMENIKGAMINIYGDVDSGKTEAALKLLNLILTGEREKSTVWINANSQCAIETSFLEVAALLGITTEKDKNGTESRNFGQIINEIYVRLNQMRTIFVFSNVNPELDINEYLSPMANNTIILTSRECLKNIKRKLYERQMEMKENDYKTYIQKTLSIPVTPEVINELTSKYNRSTIKIVTAYVKTVRNDCENYNLDNFLRDLKGSGKKLGDFIKDKIIENDKNHGETAIQILNMLCHVGQNSVPTAIFTSLKNYEVALETLQKYNLVSITDFISVHEKIQEVFATVNDNSLNTLLNLVNDYFNTNSEPTKRNECIALTHHLLQTAQTGRTDSSNLEHLSTFTNLAKVVLQSRCLEDGTSLKILQEYESYLEQNSFPIDVNMKQLKALQNIRCKKFDEALQICSELFTEVNDISHLETIMPLKITTLKKMGKIRSALKEARYWYEKCSSELGSNTESTREALQIIRSCQDTNIGDGMKSLRTAIKNHDRNVETENSLLNLVTSEIGALEVFPEKVENVLQTLQILLDTTRQLLGDFNVLNVFIQLVQVKYLLPGDVGEAEKILRTITNIKKVSDKNLLNYQLDEIIGNVYDLFARISEAMNAAYKHCDPLNKWKNLLRNSSIFAYNEIVEKLDKSKLSAIETMKSNDDKEQVVKLCDGIIGNLPVSLINDPTLLKIVQWKAESVTSEEAFPFWWHLYENTKQNEDSKSLDYLQFMGDYALQQASTSLTFRLWLKMIINDFSHKDESGINDLLKSLIKIIRNPKDSNSKVTLRIFFSHLDNITKECSDGFKKRYEMIKDLKLRRL